MALWLKLCVRKGLSALYRVAPPCSFRARPPKAFTSSPAATSNSAPVHVIGVAKLLTVDEATVRTVLTSWGPGKFDAELFMDGKAFNGNKSAATLIPPAFGLAGVNLHTWTGWGSVTHWNAFVANLEMHGKGTFFDPRLADSTRFPIAAQNGFDNVRSEVDLITPKLADLHFYQLALDAPAPPAKQL